jgi:hypothetical protein
MRNIWIALLASLIPIAAVPLVSAHSQEDSGVVISLRTYGWQPPERGNIRPPSIIVDHKNRVVVGFTVEERRGLVDRNEPSLGFHIVRFSGDGKADLSLSVPTNKRGKTGLHLSEQDQIIVRANDNLQLLQVGEGPVQNAVWKTLAPCPNQCGVVQSQTRRTLVIYTEQADPVTVIRLSPEPQLQRCGKERSLRKSIEDKIENWPQSITDTYAYSRDGEESDSELQRWPLCDYEHRNELPLRPASTALSDSLFLVGTYETRKGHLGLELVAPDGQVKFRAPLLEHESAGTISTPTRSSERGDRIAVDVLTLRGGNRTLDISSHITSRRIAVYDTDAGKQVASIPVPIRCHYGFAFALSPDGRRLAILEDDAVRIVDLDPARSDMH